MSSDSYRKTSEPTEGTSYEQEVQHDKSDERARRKAEICRSGEEILGSLIFINGDELKKVEEDLSSRDELEYQIHDGHVTIEPSENE